MCSTEMSKGIVFCLNLVLFLLSLVVLIYSAYLASELSDFQDAIDEGAIIAPSIFAGFMLVVSLLGICAIQFKIKILLFVYMIAAMFLTLSVFVSGIVLVSFTDAVNSAEEEQVIDAADSIEARLVDFGLAVYDTCCLDEFDAIDLPPIECVEDVIEELCISDLERFELFADNVPAQLCDLLSDVDINGSPIVGDPTEVNGSCANNDSGLFVSQVLDFIEDNIQPLGIVNTVLAVLMLIDLMATCGLVFFSGSEFYGKKEEKKSSGKTEDRAGPDMGNGKVAY